MRTPLTTGLCVAALLLATEGTPWAQDDAQGPRHMAEPEGPQRKNPSFFNRPAEDTPALQWALAESRRTEDRRYTALRAYSALVRNWPESEEAPKAQQALARMYFDRGRYTRSFEEYQYLMDFFAGRFPFQEVVAQQFAIANHVRNQRHAQLWGFRGYASPEEAIPFYEAVVKNAPRWNGAPEAQFQIGSIHEEKRDYEAAIHAYEVLQLRYPDSPFAVEAELRRAGALYFLAKASPRDEQSSRAALVALGSFVSRHAAHPGAAVAREQAAELKEAIADLYFERAAFYDRQRRREKAALIAYADFVKNFPSSARSDEARRRIAALEKIVGNAP
jgi:TolA-binding protein